MATAPTDPNALTTSNVDQLAALSGLMSGLATTQTTATGQATAAQATATGADAEAAAYGTAGAIADENAKVAGIAGEISVAQQQRMVAATAGQEAAAAGAGGVISGGSVYDVIQSTYTQGAIGAQMIGVQTALEQGGYEEAGAASDAEVAAAQAQKNAALAMADAYTAQASQAASQTAQLQSLYSTQITQLNNIESNPTAVGGADSSARYRYPDGHLGPAPTVAGVFNQNGGFVQSGTS